MKFFTNKHRRLALLDPELLEAPARVRQAIAAGADVNALDVWGRAPLHYNKNPQSLRLLIKASADVNAKDMYERAPLHKANSPDKALALLQAGADWEFRDYKDRTAAEYVAGDGFKSVVAVIEQWAAHKRADAVNGQVESADELLQGPDL